ncbi:TPA: DUF1642 domain-containing protein [Streptococcus suis]|nr:DUF1642 domain-containing protein [Streptococcus suis]
MNKQEAIEKLTNIANGTGWVTCTSACNIISQIDQPQTVVVPKFVAEWIESEKSRKRRLSQALSSVFDELELSLYIKQQLGDYTEIIARAWLDGYEVEQEKLYTVELPNPNNIGTEVHILMMNGFKQVVIKKELGNDWKKKKGFQLTEEEIKEDFEWAWQFAKEVE